MKSFFKTVFTAYILILLWLVLFKFSVDIPSVLLHHQAAGLNLVPFADMRSHVREVLDNVIVFVPFGLLLSVNFEQTSMWQKFGYIAAFSIAAEVFQFILAIGVADITDVIANTLGGLLGLVVYGFSSRYVDMQKQDWFITVAAAALLAMLLLLRFFVFRVRY